MFARLCAAVAGFVVIFTLLAGATGSAAVPKTCSKTTGDRLEKRLPVGPFDKRIGQTLCFDFTGDGRTDIVFSGWEYVDNGAHYWAAFRSTAAGWTSVIFKRDCCRVARATNMRISRTGAVLVVSEPIFSKARKQVGTRTGRWRWNGHVLKLLSTTEKKSS